MKKTIIISFLSGFLFALASCLIFFFFYLRSVPKVERIYPTNSVPSPTVQAADMPMSPEIKESEVNTLSLNTIYTGFFPADSKCRQSYNELFGKEDGFFSSSSPCTIDLTFNRDGSATKTIDLQRYDKESKTKKSVEKSSWTGKIADAQFAALAKYIVNTEIFKNWNDMISLTVVNTRIKVASSNRARTLMSNVDEKTVNFLPLMDAFKKLDNEVKWEKAP
jgi:hypothetical protein